MSEEIWQTNNSFIFCNGNWDCRFPAGYPVVHLFWDRYRYNRVSYLYHRPSNLHNRNNPQKEATWMEVSSFSNPSCSPVATHIVIDCILDLLSNNRQRTGELRNISGYVSKRNWMLWSLLQNLPYIHFRKHLSWL